MLKSAVARFGKDAKAHGYEVRSPTPLEAFVRFWGAEIGAVMQVHIEQRRTKSGTKDVEVITRHWHGRIDIPDVVGAFGVSRGDPGQYPSRAPIPLGGGLTAVVGNGRSAALFDEAVKQALAALGTDAKVESISLVGGALIASWRRRGT